MARPKKLTLNEYTGEDEQIDIKRAEEIQNKEEKAVYHNLVIVMIAVVVAILLFLSNFNRAGKVGAFVNHLLFGLFGLAAYVAPLIVVTIVLMYISNIKSKFLLRKVLSAIGFIITTCSVIQLANYDASMTAQQMYDVSSTNRTGGGLLGGLLCKALCSMFDKTGAMVILILFAIIFTIIITDKLLFEKAEKILGKSANSVKKNDLEKDNFDSEFRGAYVDAKYKEYKEPKKKPRKKKVSKKNMAEDEVAKVHQMHDEQAEIDDAFEDEEIEQKVKTRRGRKKKIQPYTFVREDSVEDIQKDTIAKDNIQKRPDNIVLTKDDVMIDQAMEETAQQSLYDSLTRESMVDNQAISEVYEKELDNKFNKGKVREYDIKNLVNELINGSTQVESNKTYVENIDNKKDLQNITQESEIISNGMQSVTELEEDLYDDECEVVESVSFSEGSKEDIIQVNDSILDNKVLESDDKVNSNNTKETSNNTSVNSNRINEVVYSEDETTGQISLDINIAESLSDAELGKLNPAEADVSTTNRCVNTTKSKKAVKAKKYKLPPLDILASPDYSKAASNQQELEETALKLQTTFDSFGVKVKLTDISCGPAVTRYEVQPAQGVKVSKITNLTDDIKLNLAAADIRIEAPIPGKAAVGIEVPNKGSNSTVLFRELIESKEFKKTKYSIAFAVGKDISGQVVIADIAKMPHLLIAGQTGSGKSVCINTLIMSILYRADPNQVKLIMIDPKVVELSVYNGIPHLLIPVVTDPKKASGALHWAVAEMTDRYAKFAELGVRDLVHFNEKVSSPESEYYEKYQKMPQIVIIVDELADLMMVAPGEVEDAICRLAQMARAAGIHLIIATQRPSVNVITGLIKANIPSRIAFSVASAIDSRTILDGGGAEKLLGKGDMLFYPSGYPKPVRVQGAFITDQEVGDVVDFLSKQGYETSYSEDIESKIAAQAAASPTSESSANNKNNNGKDEYFYEAAKFIIDKDKASIGMLQRVYKIGFNRAARIMDQLYDAGVVGPEEGTKPRKILMTSEEFQRYVEESA